MKKIILISAISILTILACIYAYIQSNTMLLQGEVDVKTVDLSSKITGRVSKINVKKGDKVVAGQVLVALDTPDINAKAQQTDATLELAMAQERKVRKGARNEQINMAKNTYRLAQKTYERINRLHKEGVVPTQKLDEAYTQYTVAKNNYDMLVTGSREEDKLSAQANVKKAQGAFHEVNSYLEENKIKSPIAGVVTEITVEEGELVGAGYPIVTVVDNNDNWVVFNMREDLLSKIKIGKEFYVKIPAIAQDKVKVRVNYISVLGSYATWRATKAKGDFDMKTFEVRVVPLEKIEDLRAGMSVIFDWKKLK